MLPLWYLIIGAFLSIIAVADNGIIIYLIVTRRLHNPTNWIVLSLAVADLSIGMGYVLTQYLYEVFSFEYNLWYCVVSFLFAASSTNLCLLTLDRYIFITKPLRYVALMTTRRAILMIFSVWIAPFLSHFLFYLICNIWTSPEDLDNCTRNFSVFESAVFEILPMVILSFLASHIFYIVRQRSHEMALQMEQLRLNERNEENREVPTKKERNSAIKIVGISVAVFTICSLLGLIYSVLYQYTRKPKPNWNFAHAINLLYVINSAINPVAYAFFKSDIKERLKSMFSCNGGTPINASKGPMTPGRKEILDQSGVNDSRV